MSFGRVVVARSAGQEPTYGRTNETTPAQRRPDGKPVASYAWHVAPGGVLVVVDLNLEGWRSVTNDVLGVTGDLAALRPDLLARVPVIAYRDDKGRWDALLTTRDGAFDGIAVVGAASEAEAVAWALAQDG